MPSVSPKKGSAEKEEEVKTTKSPSVTSEVPYTEEEKTWLIAQLAASPQELQDRHSNNNNNNGNTAWAQRVLPLLVSMVKKVLQLAADNYEGGTSTAAKSPSIRASGGASVAASASGKTPSKMDFFLEENNYLLEQLQLQERAFFTLPRLWEILADPFMYNTDAAGKLRGEKLQAAVRRCVLTSAPLFVVPSPFLCMNSVNTG